MKKAIFKVGANITFNFRVKFYAGFIKGAVNAVNKTLEFKGEDVSLNPIGSYKGVDYYQPQAYPVIQ